LVGWQRLVISAHDSSKIAVPVPRRGEGADGAGGDGNGDAGGERTGAERV
jgi:hypothetical protein